MKAFIDWLFSIFSNTPSSGVTPTPAAIEPPPKAVIPVKYPKGVELAGAYLALDPKNSFGNPRYIAEIDYSKRSNEKRLAVWDRQKNTVEYHKVSHGKGSGGDNTGHCKEFSNTEGSHKSCLGAFKTAETYNGGNGKSLKLDGLDATNSNARERLIVMHASDYVNENDSSIPGRSYGCPAMDDSVAFGVIDKLKGGSLLLSHYNGHFKYSTEPRPHAVDVVIPPTVSKKTLFPKQEWADHALKLVKASRLVSTSVSRETWFNNIAENWVHLLAAMCKFESSFKETSTYKENFKNSKGEYVISTGLFQVSYESVRGYGFTGITTDDLKDPFKNIEVAIKILEKWVVSDEYIYRTYSGPDGKTHYEGGSRYWAVLRKPKVSEVIDLYKEWAVK